MCNYLGRFGSDSLIHSAVSVGVPYSMSVCNTKITRLMNFLMTKLLQRKVKEFRRLIDEG